MSENIKRFPLDFEALSGELETTDVVMIAKITGESYKAELKTLMLQYLSGGISLLDLYNSKVLLIDTGDFIPVNPQLSSGWEYQVTPGSYGVTFTDSPIVGLDDTNFNLKVDYVSHDGTGGDGGQDFIHTLTTATGRIFTRRVYMYNQHVGYVSTQFVENAGGGSLIISATPPTGVEGSEWLSTNTGIRYTFLNNKWVEV